MKVITGNQQLPASILQSLAVLGWIAVIYLAYVVGMDSWERTMFAITGLTDGLPQLDPFNRRYAAELSLTLFHTIPGVAFAILGPLQFMSPIRRHAPRIHRMSGRIFLTIGIVSGLSAIAIGFRFPMWGWAANQWISLAMGIFMVFAFAKAYLHVRARRFNLHREWMIRGFATGFSVALFRVVLRDVLQRNGVEFTQGWNIVTATSAPVMLLVAELWIHATRPKRADTVATTVVAQGAS
jgi:uncharacterized membrane protein